MKSKGSTNMDLLNGSIHSVLFKLSLPIIIGNIAQTLYGLVDVYWLGKLGSNELAAITLANPIVQMLVNIGMGLGTATSIIIAQDIGKGHKDRVNVILYHVFMMILIGCGGILLLVGVFLKPILVILGSTGEVTQMAAKYLVFVLIGIELYFITNIYIALQNANGNSKISFHANVIGLLINLIISPILIIHFNLSVIGAGVASMISRFVPFLIFGLRLFSKKQIFKIRFNNRKVDWSKIKEIIKIAFPLSLGGATIQLGFMVMGRSVIQYGNIAMAAYGIGNRISSLITIPSNSIGNALTIIVGQNFGANQMQRIRKAYQHAVIFSVSYLLVLGLILAYEPITLLVSRIFITDQDTLMLTISYVKILALYCFANGFYNTTIAVFNGMSKPMISVMVDVARIWIFRIVTMKVYALIFGKSINVIWYSVVFSNGLAAIVIVILYFLMMRKRLLA